MASIYSRLVITLASACALSALPINVAAQTTTSKSTKAAPVKTAPKPMAAVKPAATKPAATAQAVTAAHTTNPNASAKPAVYTTAANGAPASTKVNAASTGTHATVTPVGTSAAATTVSASGRRGAAVTGAGANQPVANGATAVVPVGSVANGSTAVVPAGGIVNPLAQQQQAGGVPAQNAVATDGSAGVAPGAASGTAPATGYAAGLGTFRYGDVTLTAFNCLRSGTRVFCDFDETKTNTAQLPAGWVFNAVHLVLGSGRVYQPHVAHYVDTDGSTFDTAEISSNAPVRMILEYDDVPAQYTAASLAYGTDRIQSVPVSPMPATQTPNMISPRQTAAAQSADAGQTQANGQSRVQNATGHINDGIDNVNNMKSTFKGLFKKAIAPPQNQ